jgi:hypothetical protein
MVNNAKLSRIYLDTIAKKIDPHALCEKLGITIFKDNGCQIRACCPIHHGDNPTSFSIDYDVNKRKPMMWYCRTRCDRNGDVFELIKSLFDFTFPESVEWLAEFVGLEKSDVCCVELSKRGIHEKDVSDFLSVSYYGGHSLKYRNGYVSPDLNDEFVAKCINRRNGYFNKRGFDDELLNFFEVGLCPACETEWYNDRITIPFRDIDGLLMGISGRLTYNSKKNKYQILSGSNKRECLYGLQYSYDYIKEADEIILLEGFVDFWQCWRNGLKNVVAVMGKETTHEQRKTILGLAFNVVVAFDSDIEGRLGAEKTIDGLKNFCTVYQMIPPYGYDFGNLSEKKLFAVCKNMKKIVL